MKAYPAVLIAVVFGSGVLIGFAADSTLDAETPEEVVEQPREEVDAGERRSTLYSQLHPSDVQQAQIDSIVAVHRDREQVSQLSQLGQIQGVRRHQDQPDAFRRQGQTRTG